MNYLTGELTPEGYGAVGDGITDDTAALKAALADMAPGSVLYLSRTYLHSTVLSVAAPNAVIDGRGTLLAAEEQSSSLHVAAPGVRVDNITLDVRATTKRWSEYEKMRLRLDRANGFRSHHITVRNSAAAGIYIAGTKNFTLDQPVIESSRADGIHITSASGRGTVNRPIIVGAGDDGVGIVSYSNNAGPCHHIDVRNPHVRSQTWGRGVSVVGGEDITYYDVDVQDSPGAGVYIACESSYNTRVPRRVRVLGGRLDNCNTAAPNPEHGAIIAVNQHPTETMEDVEVIGVNINNCYALGSTLRFAGNAMIRCRLDNITISGRQPRLTYSGSTIGVMLGVIRRNATQFNPRPADTGYTNPNGAVEATAGSTATMLNGTSWYKTTATGNTGWQQLS